MSESGLISNQTSPDSKSDMKECFVELNEIYTAIQDMDRKVALNTESKLDDVLFAVKNIDKANYDDQFTDVIINAIRNALVDLYNKKVAEVNASIGIGEAIKTEDTSVEDTEEEKIITGLKDLDQI